MITLPHVTQDAKLPHVITLLYMEDDTLTTPLYVLYLQHYLHVNTYPSPSSSLCPVGSSVDGLDTVSIPVEVVRELVYG